MVDFKREKQVLSQIAKSQQAIRKKYMLLKHGKETAEKLFNETFKPIVSPLEKLVNIAAEPEIFKDRTIKHESEMIKDIKHEPDDTFHFSDFDTSFKTAAASSEINSNNIKKSDVVDGEYFKLFNKGNKKNLDTIYGVRKINDKMMIGDSPIEFDLARINVKNKSYPKTYGLMELLFKKEPDRSQISKADRENYQLIIEDTNAYRKRHREDTPILNSSSEKFHDFISSIPDLNRSVEFRKPKKKKVGGKLPRYKIARLNTQMDYIYWDDPNELVDRLRLLVAEQSAGNPSHINEIHSIIEELREGGYIY